MKKINYLIIIIFTVISQRGFAQFAGDGSYLWISTSVTYSFNDKTDLIISNKYHYRDQIDHLDYFHFELTTYRKITGKFSLGPVYVLLLPEIKTLPGLERLHYFRDHNKISDLNQNCINISDSARESICLFLFLDQVFGI